MLKNDCGVETEAQDALETSHTPTIEQIVKQNIMKRFFNPGEAKTLKSVCKTEPQKSPLSTKKKSPSPLTKK